MGQRIESLLSKFSQKCASGFGGNRQCSGRSERVDVVMIGNGQARVGTGPWGLVIIGNGQAEVGQGV